MAQYCRQIRSLSKLLKHEEQPYDKHVTVHGDSKMMLNQMRDPWQVRGNLCVDHAVACGNHVLPISCTSTCLARRIFERMRLFSQTPNASPQVEECVAYWPNLCLVSKLSQKVDVLTGLNDFGSIAVNEARVGDERLLLSLPAVDTEEVMCRIRPVHY